MFRPASLLATPVAPTPPLNRDLWPWLFHPGISRFVASSRPGYARRPSRATDGRGLTPHRVHGIVGCSLISVFDASSAPQQSSQPSGASNDWTHHRGQERVAAVDVRSGKAPMTLPGVSLWWLTPIVGTLLG